MDKKCSDAKPRIVIVDKNDKLIGYKKRGTLDKEDIYRVSALWITNSKNEILLARRHRDKKHHPNMWGPAVAGTVDEGESYEDNIIKEAEEELGLMGVKPTLGPKRETKDEFHHFTQWYTLVIDKDVSEFKIQEDEVEEVKWFKKEELIKSLNDSSEMFLPTMKEYVKIFKNIK